MSSKRLLLGWRWSWGSAGQLVPTASSGAWEWVVRRQGQEERGEVSVAGPGMFCLYYAVASGRLLSEGLWRQEERAQEAEGTPSPSPISSHQCAIWNWHSSVLLIIQKGIALPKKKEKKKRARA